MSNNTTSFNRTASGPSFSSRERQSGPLQSRISRTLGFGDLLAGTTEPGALTSDCIYSGAVMASCMASRRVTFLFELPSVTVKNLFHLCPPLSGHSRIEGALHRHHDRPPFFCLR